MEITINSRWIELFGSNQKDMTAEQRKDNWEKWKLAAAAENVDCLEYWTDTYACLGCKHLDNESAWCNNMGLPCTVNPTTCIKMNMSIVGMACMGLSYVPKQGELQF